MVYLKVILFLICFTTFSYSQEIKNEKNFIVIKWTKNEGLPSNNILSSILSKEGFIYLASPNGLCRFDGTNFKVYNASSNKEMKSNAIIRLYENKDGKLFISVSSQGVLIKNGKNFECISERDGLSLNHPSSISEDDDGNIYVATFGAGINVIKDSQIKYINSINGLKNNIINYLFKDSKKRIWIGSNINSTQYLASNKLFNVNSDVKQNDARVRKIIEFYGKIVFATNKGIYVFKDEKIVELDEFKFFNNKNITSIDFDSNNRLWISVRNEGLFFVKNKVIHKIDEKLIPSNIFINYINATPIGLYLGTDHGFFKISDKKIKIIAFDDEIDNNNIRSVFQITNNEVLLSNDKDVFKYNFVNDKLEKINTELQESSIYSYCKITNDSFLLGSRNYGILLYTNGNIKKTNFVSNIKSLFIRSIKRFDDTTYIIGTNGSGVLLISGKKQKYIDKSNGLVDNFIGCIMIDKNKNIWVGTSGGGISIINKNGEIIKNITTNNNLSSGIVNSITQDKNGDIWIGTSVAGICKIKNDRIKNISKSNGLVSNNIKKLIYDGENYFWITSDKGIMKISLSELNKCVDETNKLINYEYVNYTDGLLTEEFNSVSDNAGCLTNNGYFLAPSIHGLVIINTKQKFDKTEKIIAYNDEVIINQEKIFNINDLESLKPNTELIQFKFGSIAYLNIDNVTFMYKIDNLSKDWINIGNQREITLYKTPHGNYKLNLYAITSTGIKSNVLSIPFTIEPYFWQTNLFKISLIVLLLIVISILIKFYIRVNYKKKLEKLELENILINEKMRISKDMHDEIGAELTNLNLLMNKITEESNNPFYENKLNPIQEGLNSLVQLIDEIVWAINPKNDSLENTILYSVDFANEIFNNSKIDLHVEIPSLIPELNLKSEIRHNLLLAIKEVMTNSIKHSGGKNFWYKVNLINDYIEIEMKDDGIGFEVYNNLGFSNGLNNIKQRVNKIKGEVIINSIISLGTTISIKIKL